MGSGCYLHVPEPSWKSLRFLSAEAVSLGSRNTGEGLFTRKFSPPSSFIPQAGQGPGKSHVQKDPGSAVLRAGTSTSLQCLRRWVLPCSPRAGKVRARDGLAGGDVRTLPLQ